MNSKKIMVIAGGDWQIELVRKAKKMGFYVVCSNLYEDSPAFPFADACEVADVLDKEKNLQIAKKYQPDAVISDQSDIAVPTVAYVNEKLNLRGIGIAKAELFTDKAKMRDFCKQNGILVPDYKLCETQSDAIEMLNKYKKIIIKPVDSQSSRGVFTIESEEDLAMHIEETISYSNKSNQFLAEQYVEGEEFTVDGIVVDGKHYPLCISIKEMYEKNPNISRMQTYSNQHEKYDYQQLRRVNKHLIETAALPFGLTHSEYKYWNGEYYLIEAGARGGGSNLSAKIVPFISGIDNYEYLINSYLGENVDTEELEKLSYPNNKFVIMRFFDFEEGKVKKVYGREVLDECENMIDYQLNVDEGDVLQNPKYGRLRPGHFIIGGDDLNALEQQTIDILNAVRIEYE